MFKKKYSISAIVFVSIAISVVTFLVTAVYLNDYYKQKQQDFIGDKSYIMKLSSMDDLIREKFFFDIDESYLEEMTFKGFVAGLDDQFTYYLTPKEANLQNQSSSGELTGIGIYATYDTENDAIYITSVMENSPAEKSGLLPGDLIVKVEDIEVTRETYYEAIYSVPGDEGTEVTITVARYPDYSKKEEITLERAKVVVNSVDYEMLEGDIAYITISEFNDNTDEQFVTLLNKAKNEGAQGIIFDVRNNPGGNLESVCNILDVLLPQGPIVHIVDKEDNILTTISSDDKSTNLPMVVLMNRNTASGGELFSSALRDYEIATLIGEKTFGKGCMQTVYNLDDGSMIVLTTNLYNPPYGENYHGIGVEPQLKVEMTDEMMQNFAKLKREDDPQFQAALSEIASKISESK